MSSYMDLKVGDEVIVSGKYVRNGRTKVSKVGRTYFYVERNDDVPYQRINGQGKRGPYGIQSRAWIPELFEADRFRNATLAQIQAHNMIEWRNFGGASNKFSTERLVELLAFLDEVAKDEHTTH